MENSGWVRRFLFEGLDIRGAMVRLEGCWQSMLRGRMYAQPVAELLGEMAAVTALIAEQMKQDGRLTLQLRGGGAIQRMVMDCTASLQLRGMAHADMQVAPAPAPVLLGVAQGGQLLMSLDLPGAKQPYQSIVPLKGDSVAEIFEHFLAQSEQQPARLFMVADEQTAACLFLQKLPGADAKDEDGWARLTQLAATVKPEELRTLDAESLLFRLFHEEIEASGVRVFDAKQVTHHCPEDWEKVRGMLRALGRGEAEAILDEHGEILIKDDICNREYRFTADMVAALFAEGQDGQPSLH